MLRILLALCAASACGGKTQRPKPAPSNTTAVPKPTSTIAASEAAAPTAPQRVRRQSGPCAAHRRALRGEYCDPAAPAESCVANHFACQLTLDLDGDGSLERVAVEASGDSITLVVHWAQRPAEVLASSAEPLQLAGSGESFDDFAWLLYWKALPRYPSSYFQIKLGKQHRFVLNGAEGDALFLSSGDAAGALFRRKGTFVFEQLGF